MSHLAPLIHWSGKILKIPERDIEVRLSLQEMTKTYLFILSLFQLHQARKRQQIVSRKQSHFLYLLSVLAIILQTFFVFIDIKFFPFSNHTVAKYYFVVDDENFYRLGRGSVDDPDLVYDRILFKNHHIMKGLLERGVPFSEWRSHLYDDFDHIWRINIKKTPDNSVQETVELLWEKKP